MNVEIFDERRCLLGEGPIAYGSNHELVAWVDILKKKVHFRNIATSATDEMRTDEDVSFVISRNDGGFILGTSTGPVGISPSIDLPLLKHPTSPRMRFNDAKVSPQGDLWFGTMSYDELPEVAALYRLSSRERTIQEVVSNVSISNGTVWSTDGSLMYFIDSPTRSIWVFDYDGYEISNKRLGIRFPDEFGYPDGMTIDSQGGLWVAFWMGSGVRRFDPALGFKESARIMTPAKRATSCVFAGENLEQLIITSSHSNDVDEPREAGMTYICEPGVTGLPTAQFLVHSES